MCEVERNIRGVRFVEFLHQFYIVMPPKPRQTHKTQTLVAKSAAAPATVPATTATPATPETELDKVSDDLQYCYGKLFELKGLIISETDARQLKDHVTRFGNFLVSSSLL